MIRFLPGQVVLHRNTRRGRVAFARPVRVVSDGDLGLLLWMARGTPAMYEVAPDGSGARGRPFADWVDLDYEMRHGQWQGPGILLFFPPDANHSVWWFFDDDGVFQNWYVNLEERAVRWDDGDVAGIDVVDQDLDIVVAPDRSWEWKDEDEFTERLAFPDHYWVADEQAVRAEGRRVVKQIEAGDFPFDGTWTDFVPDPAWTLPELPNGWERPALS
jgi:protein associated with RNAse G/E